MKMKIGALLFVALATACGAAPAFDLDAAIEAKAKQKNLPASAACDDTTFLRRVSLDLAGVIPTPEQVEAFLADTRPDKRARLVEDLLASPGFDLHMAQEMRQFMIGKSEAKPAQLIARRGIEEWLQERVAAKDGYDKIVSQLITAEGPFTDNPAVGFVMKKDATPEDLTAKTGKVFLGAQIQCAQCHDHPFEKWKQTDFYGMVSFFSRTRSAPLPEPALELVRKGIPVPMIRQLIMGQLKGNDKPAKPGQAQGRFGGRFARAFQNMPEEQRVAMMMRRMGMEGGMMESGDGDMPASPPPTPADVIAIAHKVKQQIEAEMGEVPGNDKDKKKKLRRIPVVFDAPRGEAVIPDPKAGPGDNPKKPKGTQVAPRFLDGTTPATDGKRRQQLAAWMISPKNPFFAKAAVNRFFSLLTGEGLVMPVDNIVAPSTNALAPVLDQLAGQFVEHGYDLRWLCRTVCNSKIYQRDLAPATGAEKDREFFTHAALRQLTPEQLFASFLQATGAEEMARGVVGERFEQLKQRFLAQFVFTFENDEGAEVEVFHETIPQALMLMNSGLINRPVQAGPGGVLAKIAAKSSDPKDRIDHLYLATLSRHATPEELAKLVEHVKGRLEASMPDMPGMDDPEPMTARDLVEDLPMGKGRRFGLGAMAQLRQWRQRYGMGPKSDAGGEPGGWLGMAGVRARFGKQAGDAQAAVVAAPSAPPPSAQPSVAIGPNPWKSPGERQAYEDIFWSLVSCSEFLYNH